MIFQDLPRLTRPASPYEQQPLVSSFDCSSASYYLARYSVTYIVEESTPPCGRQPWGATLGGWCNPYRSVHTWADGRQTFIGLCDSSALPTSVAMNAPRGDSSISSTQLHLPHLHPLHFLLHSIPTHFKIHFLLRPTRLLLHTDQNDSRAPALNARGRWESGREWPATP